MSVISDFISQYTQASQVQIGFAWNGKHAQEFEDSNQEFRWQIANQCIAQPESASPVLLEHLFMADAEWTAEAWGSPQHFAQLATVFLERGQEAAVVSFSTGFTRSFDTFGACHEIQLSDHLRSRLTLYAKELLSQTADDSRRKQLEAVIELFAKLESKTATHGWAKVSPGTPVSDIRVVSPHWYHRLWAKLSGLWHRRAN